MYGKTIDSKHLHERTGSHSTKGSGRCTAWWATDHDPLDEILPPEVRDAMRIARAIYKEVRNIASDIQAAIVPGEPMDPRTKERLQLARARLRQLDKNRKAVVRKYTAIH